MKEAKHKNKLIPVSLIGTTILTGTFLLSTKTNADDVIDTTAITVPVSCTMSGTGQDTHHDEVLNGTSKENIGTTTIKAFCNDSEGFAIYAVGFGGDTLGTTVLKDSNLDSSFNINTGTTFTGTSEWAMKLGVTTGTYTPIISGSSADPEAESGDTDYSTWAEVPSQYTRVAYRTSGTDVDNDSIASAEGATLTTTYKAYISPTQPSGTYTGQVKYTLVHPADERPLQPQPSTAGCINYFANASNAEGTMGCQSQDYRDFSYYDIADGEPVTLLASNFSRTGYGFAGWSDAYDYATNPSANFYGPSETITAPEGTTANGLSLYAVWIKSEGSLQDTSKVASVCSSLTTAPTDGTANLTSVSALTDQRDNNTYAIAKLADGNCWMIENLRLDNTATLTLANTNNPLNDGTDVTLKHNYSDTETYNNLSPSQDPTTTAWCGSNAASCFDQSMLYTGNTTSRATSPVSNNNNIYGYGNYYNWYSATAGRGTYSFSNNNESVTGDLCPAGWRLPQGGNKTRIESDDDNDFWNLTVDALNNGTTPANYSSNTYPYYDGTAEAGPVDKKLRSYPNNFLYSGYVFLGTMRYRGSYGYSWSSTALSSDYAYYLLLISSGVGPGTYSYGSKYTGRTVRCIAPGA